VEHHAQLRATTMGLRTVQFLAVIFTALALVPGGAHFFVLLNKIELDQAQYFTVQSIYRGWALFGIVLFGALFLNLAMAVMLRDQRTAFWFAVAGFIGLAINLAIFFIWTYPANVATDNWTTVPENWQALRAQWEYSHAVNALVMFASFCMVTLSVLTTRR
jgi:hypothetical protein